MSFTDRLMVWLHIAFVIFAIGPVTLATMSTPRYIRARNVGVLRYLSLMTRIFGAASLGVLLFGIIAAQSLHKISQVWVTVSMTLFVVAAVLLLLIMRDQRRAIAAVEASAMEAGAAAASAPGVAGRAASEPAVAAGSTPAGAEPTAADVEPAPQGAGPTAAQVTAAPPSQAAHVASVERGRIASLAGVVSLIWLVILVLMVWNS
jgi:hypothetical protein